MLMVWMKPLSNPESSAGQNSADVNQVLLQGCEIWVRGGLSSACFRGVSAPTHLSWTSGWLTGFCRAWSGNGHWIIFQSHLSTSDQVSHKMHSNNLHSPHCFRTAPGQPLLERQQAIEHVIVGQVVEGTRETITIRRNKHAAPPPPPEMQPSCNSTVNNVPPYYTIDFSTIYFCLGSCMASLYLKVDAALWKTDSCIDSALFVVCWGFIR